MIAPPPSCQPARRNFTRVRWILVGLAVGLLVTLAPPNSMAGVISVAWDEVPDADLAGYRVFVGTAPGSSDVGVYDVVGNVTSKTLSDLPDCVTLYVAVKAFDFSGNESASFSDSIDGMTQPSINSVNPTRLEQGTESAMVRLTGGSFSPQMAREDVIFDHDEIRVLGLNWLSCSALDVTVSVGPFVLNPGDPGHSGEGTGVELVDPAEAGAYPVLAIAPDGSGNSILGGLSCSGGLALADCVAALAVEWLPQRTDADLSGRVDGVDLARISRAVGGLRCTNEEQAADPPLCDRDVAPFDRYDASVDLNGDKRVDGVDIDCFVNLFGAVEADFFDAEFLDPLAPCESSL